MSATLRLIFLFAGGMLIVASALSAAQTRRFIAQASERDGIVTGLNAGGSHPQIMFHTVDGTAVSYAQGGMIAGFQVGQTVRVVYDAGNPRGTARVRSFGSLWGGSVALALLGACLLGLGIASLRFPIGFYFGGR